MMVSNNNTNNKYNNYMSMLLTFIFFLELHEKLFLYIKSFNSFVSSPIFNINYVHNKTYIEFLMLTEDCYNYGDLQVQIYGNIYDPLVDKIALPRNGLTQR